MFAIDVQLLDGQYHAALTDRAVAEWPPHPARIFCALVAGARTDAEWDALRWLEGQDAPDVVAAQAATQLRRAAFVVTNKREAKGGSQFHPGRTNQLRTRVSAQPDSDRIRFEWPAAAPDDAVFATLDRLALRVPYFGRSTTAVLAMASTDPAADERARFEPCALTDAEFDVRVPYVGYVDALRAAYDAGRPAADAARLLGYRLQHEVEAEPVRYDSPFAELVVVRTPDVRPDGRLAPLFTEALRTALLKRIPKPVPDVVHGHGVDDRTHVGFLALPVAGLHRHDRGHVVGLALALPTMPADERRKVLRALVGDDPSAGWKLDVPGLGEYTVRFDRDPQKSERSSAEFWTKRSDTWVTATPMALDRHPKKGDEIAALISRSCALAGYPEPIDVTVSHSPLTPGGVQLRANDLPKWLQHRPLRHVRLRFDGELTGPVLVGAGRYLGVGLFLPERAR